MAEDFLPNYSSPNSPPLLLVPRSHGDLQFVPQKNHPGRNRIGPNANQYGKIRKTLRRRLVGEDLLRTISNRVPDCLRRPLAALHRRRRLHRGLHLHRPRRRLQAGDERRPEGVEAPPPHVPLRLDLLPRLHNPRSLRHLLPLLHRPPRAPGRRRRRIHVLRRAAPLPRRRLLPDGHLAALERRLRARRLLRIRRHGQELRAAQRKFRGRCGYNPRPQPPSRNGAFCVRKPGCPYDVVGATHQGYFGNFLFLVVLFVLLVQAGDRDGVVLRLQIIPS